METALASKPVMESQDAKAGLSRRVREQMKSGMHRLFRFGQRAGWDILPRHFYSGIPDIRQLDRTDKWKLPSSMVGVRGTCIESQLQFVKDCCPRELQERLRTLRPRDEASRLNGDEGYGPVEADFLFCFIASKRPRKIIQIGSGVSTAVTLLAAKEAGYRPEIICVDPFPTEYLLRLADQKQISLIREKAEEADLEILTDVASGDLLFVDSTHATRPGSDVNRIILEVLPRLRAGAFVHFHDIYFPYDYQTSLLTTLFFSGESTLLHAFLIGNAQYEIAASLSMMHHGCPEELKAILPAYHPAEMDHGLYTSRSPQGHFPSATWLRVRE